MLKHLPNLLSVSRIIISIVLLFLFNDRVLFFVFYIFAGITDMLDGYIARKYKLESVLGAKLDSIADVFFYIALFLYLFFMEKTMLTPYVIFIIFIIVLRIANIIIGVIKFRELIMLHTIANKLAGLFVFLLPIFLWLNIKIFIPVVLCVTILATIEELLIILKNKRDSINVNQRSILK